MFGQAQQFSIHGSQFIYNAGSGTQPASQNPIITYEQIKLKTPTAPAVFTGRDELVAEAVQELCHNDPAHLAILGAGGMGKTALALHILKNDQVKEKFGDKIYFIPCEMCSDAQGLLQILIQTMQLSVPQGKTGYDMLETYFAFSQRSILLVLDNFETPWYLASDQGAVQNVVDVILDQRKVSVILTMRAADGPGNRTWVKLGGDSGLPPLKLDKARQAFMLISNSQNENVKMLNWILMQVECMPLAILLIAQLRKKRLTLDTLIEEWKDQKTKMLQNGQKESRLTSVAVSIGLSLQMLEKQNTGCIKLLPILSYLPNGVPMWQEQLNKLVPQINHMAVKILVIQLLDLALIYQENGTLKMLSPIQEYVQIKYPAQKEHLNQMGEYYVELVKECKLLASGSQPIIEQHITNIVKVLGVQIQISANESYLDACNSVFRYTKFCPVTLVLIDIALRQKWVKMQGNFRRIKLRSERVNMLRWMGRFEEAKKEIKRIQSGLLSDLRNDMNYSLSRKITRMTMKIQCFHILGEISQMESKYAEAKEMFMGAKFAFEKIGDQLGAARCLQSLGNILPIESKYIEARAILLEAKSTFENIGNQVGAAQCLQSLGDIWRVQGRYPEARTMLLEAKSAFDKIGAQLDAARCIQSLGEILWMENHYPEARAMILEAKSTFENFGFQLGAAQCLRSLGDILQMQNKYIEAREVLLEAKSAFEIFGEQLGVGQCLRSLGETWGMQNKYSEARVMLLEAKSAFEGIGDQLSAAGCMKSLGDILQMQNRYPEARAILLEAKSAMESFGDQFGAAWCLQSLGDLWWMENKYPEAKALLVEAKSVFENVGSQLGATECLKSLGKILQLENKYPAAATMLMEAKSAFENIGNQLGAAQCLQCLGDIRCMQSRYPEARAMVLEAKSIFEIVGSQLGAAECLRILGNILRMENHSEAKATLLQAKFAFENISSQLGSAKCLQDLAGISYLEDRYPEARALLLEAKSAFETIGDQLGAAQCLQSLGNISRKENQYPQARTMLLEAKSIFQGIGNQLGNAQCLHHLGNILQAECKHSEAKEMLLKAKLSFEHIGDQLGIAKCLQDLDRISLIDLNHF